MHRIETRNIEILLTKKNIVNLKTIEEGYHDQGMFRELCDIAPNVVDVRK